MSGGGEVGAWDGRPPEGAEDMSPHWLTGPIFGGRPFVATYRNIVPYCWDCQGLWVTQAAAARLYRYVEHVSPPGTAAELERLRGEVALLRDIAVTSETDDSCTAAELCEEHCPHFDLTHQRKDAEIAQLRGELREARGRAPVLWVNGARLARKGDTRGGVWGSATGPGPYYDTPLYASAVVYPPPLPTAASDAQSGAEGRVESGWEYRG